MLKLKKISPVVIICLGLFFSLTSGAGNQPSFPSKDITFIVPSSPGGGFDTTARILVPYLQKYLPKRVNVIVRNMPGGEWMIGINSLYRSRPDGHTIGIFNMPGNVVHMITGRARFDLTKITWIGTPDEITYIAALSPKSKFRTLKDLQEAPEVAAGTSGLASTVGLSSILAAETMGIKMKCIPHDGSGQAVLAAIRGDVDWVQYPFSTLYPYFEGKDLIPFVTYAKKRLPELPDVPTIVEMGYPQLLSIVTMFRPVGGPPEMPDRIAQVWRETFRKAVHDPDFLAAMKKGRLEPAYYGPEETAQMAVDSLKTFSRYKDILLKYLL